MRKFFALVCVCMLSLCVFAGCKETPNLIQMSTYFQHEVQTKYMEDGKEVSKNLALNTFTTSNRPSLKQYTSLTLTGNSSWLFGMYIDYILFDIVATNNAEIGFKFTLTNLEKGNEQNIVSGTNAYKENMIIDVKTKPQTKRIEIKDVVASNSVNTILKFLCTTQDLFVTNGQYNTFAYAIYNIRIVGEHAA